MRNRLIDGIADKPAVCHVHFHFFQCSAQRGNAIDMLNQHDFEQNHRVNTRPAVVLAIQIAHEVVNSVEVDGRINLPEQMVHRNHLLQAYKFDHVSVFSIFCQHLDHPSPLYHTFPAHLREKGRPKRPFSTGCPCRIAAGVFYYRGGSR